jgi:orotate phosphoribosyltransferase
VNPAEIREVFDRYGVMQTGHFRLSSGRHSDTYLQCQRLLEHPRLTASLGEAIAERFDGRHGAHPEFNVVVSPAVGAILIGNAVAYAGGARFVFAERVDGAMTLRRGQELGRHDRALVVEDVITTGGSAGEVAALAEARGAAVIGVGSLVDRSSQKQPFRLESLLRIEARDYDPDRCPLCAAGEALTAPGSRYMAKEAP